MPYTVNIFIAGSVSKMMEGLSVIEEKESIRTAAQKESTDEIIFKTWTYDSDIEQCLEHNSAQGKAERRIKQSDIFILVADKFIGDVTNEEFQLALSLKNKNLRPTQIYICYHQYQDPSVYSGNFENTISFSEFEEKNLKNYIQGFDGKFRNKPKAYPIPYTDPEDLEQKIKTELFKWKNNGHLPLPGIRSGEYVKAEDIYGNIEIRKSFCKSSCYFRRHFDNKLDQAIEDRSNRFICIYGASLSGKSRAVLETIWNHKNYLFRIISPNVSSDNDIKKQIKEITAYLDLPCEMCCEERQFVVLDDIDLLDDVAGEEISDLFNASKGTSNICFIATSGAPFEKHLPAIDENETETVEIPLLKKESYEDAALYFGSNAFKKPVLNPIGRKGPNTIGSMLLYAEDKKKDYEDFIAYYNKEARKSFGREINLGNIVLRSVMAMKLYRRKNVGNIDNIKDFSRFLVNQHYILDKTVKTEDLDKCFGTLFKNAKKALCQCYGIEGRNDSISIQDFVYDYYIDYEGNARKSDVNTEELTGQKLELVEDILSYSCEKGQDDLLETSAKLCSRADGRKQENNAVAEMISNVWNSEFDQKDTSWRTEIKNIKKELHAGTICYFGNNLKKTANFYSRFYSASIDITNDINKAKEYYNNSRSDLRTPLLFIALIKKYDSIQEIQELEDYTKFSGYPEVLSYLGKKAKTFEEALGLIKAIGGSCSPNLVGNALALADSEEKLAELKRELKKNTTVDLLLASSKSGVKSFAEAYFKNDIEKAEEFLSGEFRPQVQHMITMNQDDRHLANNIQQTGSILGRGIITSFINSGVKFDKVETKVFNLLAGNDTIPDMRNSFVYADMLDIAGRDYYTASHFLERTLLERGHNSQTPILVTSFILNRLLKKAIGTGWPADKETAKGLFEKYGVNKDTYTYNTLMSAEATRDGMFKVFNSLLDSTKCTAYIDSLSKLIHFAPSFPDALAYFPDNIIDEINKSLDDDFKYSSKNFDRFPRNPELKRKIGKKLPNYRDVIGSSSLCWKELLQTRCPNGYQKLFYQCVCYIINKDPEREEEYYALFLKNKTYWSDARSIKVFLSHQEQSKEQPWQKPWIVEILADHIIDDFKHSDKNENASEKSNTLLNQLFYFKNRRWGFHEGFLILYIKKLSLYTSHTQKLTSRNPFPYERGTPEFIEYTPIELLEELNKRYKSIGGPKTLKAFFKIKDGIDQKSVERLARLVPDYIWKTEDDKEILRSILSYSTLFGPEARKKFPDMLLEENIRIEHLVQDKNMNLEEAIQKVNTSNTATARRAYNAILKKIISEEGSFKKAIETYKKVFRNNNTEGILPDLATIKLLLLPTKKVEEVSTVMDILEEIPQNDRLGIADIRTFNNVVQHTTGTDEIISLCDRFLKVTGLTDETVIDIVIGRLVVVKDEQYLPSIMDSIINGHHDAPEELCNRLTLFEVFRQNNVSANIIESLIRYNIKCSRYGWSDLIKAVRENYAYVYDYSGDNRSLLQLLFFKKNSALSHIGPYRKIDMLHEAMSIAGVNAWGDEKFLSGIIDELENYDDYKLFIESLELGQRYLNDFNAVRLIDWLNIHRNDDNKLKDIFKTVSLFSECGFLRWGHFRQGYNTAFLSPGWGVRPLCPEDDKTKFYQNKKKDIIYFIQNLEEYPERYYICLKCIYERAIPLSTMRRYLKEYEDDFARSLKSPDTSDRFLRVAQLPRLWYFTGWKPSPYLFKQIILKAARLKRHEKKNISKLSKSIIYRVHELYLAALANGDNTVSISYRTITSHRLPNECEESISIELNFFCDLFKKYQVMPVSSARTYLE